MGTPSNDATEITPPSVIVQDRTSPFQSSLNKAQYSAKSNATQPQLEPTNLDPVSLSSTKDSYFETKLKFHRASQPCFAKTFSMKFSNDRIFTAKYCHIIVNSANFSRAPKTDIGNNATVLQVVPVTGGGSVYQMNSSSGANFEGSAIPNIVVLTAAMTIGGPEVVPAGSIALIGTYCFQGTRFSSTAGVLKKRQSNVVETGAIQRQSFTRARMARPV